MDTFSELIKQEQELLLKLSKETDGWTFVTEDQNGKLYSKQFENSTVDFLKITSEIPCPLKTIQQVLFEKISDWTEEMTKATLKEKYDENLHLVYFFTSLGYMVSDRDFVVLSGRKIEDNRVIICSKSVDLKEYPEIDGIVRGEVIHSGFVLEAEGDNKTIMYYFTQADPKGWIPTWVTNMAGPKMLERLSLVKKALNIE